MPYYGITLIEMLTFLGCYFLFEECLGLKDISMNKLVLNQYFNFIWIYKKLILINLSILNKMIPIMIQKIKYF